MQVPSFLPTSSLTAHHNTKNIYIIWLQEYSTETIAEWLHKIYILKMIPNMMLMQVVPLYARYDATPLSQLHLKNFPFPSPFFFKMAGILHEWEDQTSHRGTKLMQAWLLRLHRASSRFCSWCAWHDVKHDACCQEEWMMRGVRVHMSTIWEQSTQGMQYSLASECLFVFALVSPMAKHCAAETTKKKRDMQMIMKAGDDSQQRKLLNEHEHKHFKLKPNQNNHIVLKC